MSAVTLLADRRGSSTALGYVLSLGISALLVTGLLIAGGGLLEGQRDRSVGVELRVVGQTVADDLASASRLADCDSCELTMRIDAPPRIAGEAYLISLVEVAAPDTYRLSLTTERSEVTVDVRLRTRLPVAETTVTGGTLVVEYDPAAGELEVRGG
ncbi:MAG: hypothetical protein ABEH58_04785 [Haloplanus sp.]